MDPREELQALRRMAELEAKAGGMPQAAPAAPAERQEDRRFGPAAMRQRLKNEIGGIVRGAGSIGATLLASPDDLGVAMGVRSQPKSLSGLITGQQPMTKDQTRRADMDAGLRSMGADTESMQFQVPKVLTEIAGTLGTGNVLARGAEAIPWLARNAAPLIDAVRSAGFSAGGMTGIPGAVVRGIGGGVTGGASTALADPSNAKTGAQIGAALPVGAKVLGAAGSLVGQAGRAMVPKASPEAAALAKRAQELGIEVPLDRIVNNKPLNAVAASLNYVPLSGRAGTEARMATQLDRALSRTFGQDSENVTQALRRASSELGAKFDATLQANTVKMTPAFKTALAEAETQANSELGTEAASVIRRQIAEIQTKGAAGAIDGQAAYNIKKALDRIGNGSSDAAFYARELKKSLMAALNESLGPTEAAAFAKTRQQYGNMLALERLAQNGAEGGVSAARLANMKNINNQDLQELADIAAQFMRTRESPHGALQRLVIGGTAVTAGGAMGALPVAAGTAAAGRGVNALLNSQGAKNAAMGVRPQANALSLDPELQRLLFRSAPVLSADR